jgi:hypothetical protein
MHESARTALYFATVVVRPEQAARVAASRSARDEAVLPQAPARLVSTRQDRAKLRIPCPNILQPPVAHTTPVLVVASGRIRSTARPPSQFWLALFYPTS